MSALDSRTLFATPLLQVRDVRCSACRGRHVGAAECDPVSHIVIPYRGTFVRRVGTRVAHADVNQALFFNAGEEYRIDHATDEGDACLSFDVSESALTELTGRESFNESHRRIDPALQLLVARLRSGSSNELRAEEISLRIARGLLSSDPGRRTVTTAQWRLAHRAKEVMHSDPRHRWSLSELARAIQTSAVHLTQTFSKVEGMPLYRYQTQLRLALALHALPQSDDLAALALDLGFSSHSQFTTAFKRMYGAPPSAYQAQLKNRKAPTSAAN
jgi:AraC family transcriptional regulator